MSNDDSPPAWYNREQRRKWQDKAHKKAAKAKHDKLERNEKSDKKEAAQLIEEHIARVRAAAENAKKLKHSDIKLAWEKEE